MISSFFQTLFAFMSAALGALLAISLSVSHRQLCILISFAAGTLLGVTFFHILPEAWHIIPLAGILLALVSGYALFYFLSRYVSHVCPACAATHFEEQSAARFKGVANLLAIALTIHSMMDGVAITLQGDVPTRLDLALFLSISIHKLPEGLALCGFLLRGGYEKKKAFFWALLLETSTLLGWSIGSFLVRHFQAATWLQLILIHIGGGFIYLALHAILNESEEHSPRIIIVCFLAGLIVMGLVP